MATKKAKFSGPSGSDFVIWRFDDGTVFAAEITDLDPLERAATVCNPP